MAASSTDEALKSLLDGKIDLAAIGRPLSAAEKAQGLKETPIGREKIAIIVGSDNPFSGDLTFEQFAKIFRGEITNWSELGGAPGAIRFIDRPGIQRYSPIAEPLQSLSGCSVSRWKYGNPGGKRRYRDGD